MALALCACLVGLLVLLAIRHSRRPERPEPLTESQNALDRGLSHLIKDISREPVESPTLSRTWTIGDMTSASVSARSRLARGTPADPVLLGSRLAAVAPAIARTSSQGLPGIAPAIARTSSPGLHGLGPMPNPRSSAPAIARTVTASASVSTRLPSASMAIPRTLTAQVPASPVPKTGFEADDDAPTTLSRALPDLSRARR